MEESGERTDLVEQPETKEELVLIVRLQDGDTDPEELHQDVHLVLLAGLVLDLHVQMHKL